jgi:glyoxylase-like metal-dependent hydrolase (beta-lactamase superfamily II)
MTEPAEVAEHAERVVDGLWHWRIANRNIGGSTSSCQLIEHDGRAVLIDPVQLADAAWRDLPAPQAIVLTAKVHQRSAWRYRKRFGAEVWAPAGTRPTDEQPDHLYGEGDQLPAGLQPLRTPGPEQIHFCLLSDHNPGVLFCSDLLSMRNGRLEFVPLEYHDDPAGTRRSVQGLLDETFSVLCLDHGAPITDRPKDAIRDLLERTA